MLLAIIIIIMTTIIAIKGLNKNVSRGRTIFSSIAIIIEGLFEDFELLTRHDEDLLDAR